MSTEIKLVGIGASAGGLEALQKLVANLNPTQPYTYIVAQHLSPSHASILSELLLRSTQLNVKELQDDQMPEQGTLYIVPPNSDAILSEGKFRLFAPENAIGPKPSIDRLFTSLAQELGAKSIGIILSGTGGDGAKGLQKIKNTGGLAIVQDPCSSKFSGMPNAALLDSRIDYIVLPEEISDVLTSYALGDLYEPTPSDGPIQDLQNILQIVYDQAGLDLSGYKHSTLLRRLQRRIQLLKCADIVEYSALLTNNKEECALFAREVLISVTEFFRDIKAFNALNEIVFEFINEITPKQELRIWNPACATGEETYSLAICLEENIRKSRKNIRYKIFATDIDISALGVGRVGSYHTDSCHGLPPELLERYFDSDGDKLVISKTVRNNIVFTDHNLVQDPPFSRLDLISCRNLLIYFNNDLQKRILNLFNYSLKPNGLLFLGRSESIELHKDLFVPVDREARIFRKQTSLVPSGVLVRNFETPTLKGSRTPVAYKQNQKPVEFYVQKFIIEQFAPPGLVINKMDEIIFVTGNVDAYVTMRPGPAGNNVFNSLRNEFRAEARALIHKARRSNAPCQGSIRRIADSPSECLTKLEVRSLFDKQDSQLQDALVLLFQSHRPENNKRLSRHKSPNTDIDVQERMEVLESELASTQEYLQNVIEELETSNEELQSLTEELQSSNEELQSTNEELQTSNEELQSTNEELLTVNEEIEVKSRELESTLSDLQNLLNSTEHPLLVIDKNLRITRYVSAVEQLIEKDTLHYGDVISSVGWKVEIPDLRATIRQVLESGHPYRSTLSCDNRHYQFLILPYQFVEGQNQGAVISFPEITELVQAHRQVGHNEEHLRTLVKTLLVGIINIDQKGIICKVNPTAEHMFGYLAQELVGQSVNCLMPPDMAARHKSILTSHKRSTQSQIIDKVRELQGMRKDGSIFPIELAVAEFQIGDETFYSGVVNDISKRKLAEKLLIEERLRAQVTLQSINECVITVDANQLIEYVNPAAEKLIGQQSQFVQGGKLSEIFRIYDDKTHLNITSRLLEQLDTKTSIIYPEPVLLKHISENEYSIDLSIAPMIASDGMWLGSVLSFEDVTNKRSLLQQMTWQAQHDPLTGLANRKEFEQRLEHALLSAKSFNREHALLYLDLDQFKVVNDTCGHHAGDELLRQLANILCTSLRNRDTLARMGGDEFAILLENSSLPQAESIAEKLIETVQEFRFAYGDRIFKIGVSIGVAAITKDSGDVSDLLINADSSCYVAKERGRNRVQLHSDDDIDLQSRQRDMHWVNRLNNAIDENRLQLYFQSIRSLKTPTKHHFEVLIRLIDERGDLVPPGAFLPAAERYGLMTNIDQWVLKRLFSELNKLDSVPMISVNLSGVSLVNPKFFVYVTELLKNNIQLAPKICFEITETAAITNFKIAQEFIRSVKKFGCLFALDDFGSGMSSFGYLKNLPVDFLKIDGVFVKDILHDPIDLFMVESVNKIAQLMSMETIAEFAENDAIIEKLTMLGVDYAQGYAINRPTSLEQFISDTKLH